MACMLQPAGGLRARAALHVPAVCQQGEHHLPVGPDPLLPVRLHGAGSRHPRRQLRLPDGVLLRHHRRAPGDAEQLLGLERHRHFLIQLRRAEGQRLLVDGPRHPATLQLLPARTPDAAHLRIGTAATPGCTASARRELRRYAVLPAQCALLLPQCPGRGCQAAWMQILSDPARPVLFPLNADAGSACLCTVVCTDGQGGTLFCALTGAHATTPSGGAASCEDALTHVCFAMCRPVHHVPHAPAHRAAVPHGLCHRSVVRGVPVHPVALRILRADHRHQLWYATKHGSATLSAPVICASDQPRLRCALRSEPHDLSASAAVNYAMS